MDNRLGIGVHVHHHIGIAGQAQQGEPQHVQLADSVLAQLGQVLAHGGAHQGDIVGAVIAPLPGQPGAHWLGQLGVASIEIVTTVQGKTAHRLTQHALPQADRVGHRHDNHFSNQLIRLLGRRQRLRQMVQHQHARQFVGVQAGLQIHLGPGAGHAKMQADHVALHTQAGRGQRVGMTVHASSP